MNRRPAGVGLVLLAIVGAVVVAGPGRRLGGTAVAAVALTSAPALGDCLIDPLDPLTEFPTDRTRQVPQYGPCADHEILGEVVAVRTPAPAGLTSGWDEKTGCRTEMLAQAGLVERNGTFGLAEPVPGDPVDWQYSIAGRTVWVTQIPWAPRASAWATCVVMPLGWAISTQPIAGVFRGGRLPDEYGTCWMSRDVDASMRMINCALPHVAELIAVGHVNPLAVTEDEILASCTRQAGLVMDRPDPTAGGLLAVRVVPDTPVLSARTRNVTCFLTTADDRELMGSLIGLGSKPVRFAG
jgi:hypothetical protein